jgi:hypothetical protein
VLNNCLLFANSVIWSGGGAAYSTLNNCTVVNNSDGSGAALENCSANNSIVYYNSGPNAANSTLNYSCTTPDPGGGIGNIIVEPLLVDWPHGNFHLQTNSPCVNAGNNAFVTGAVDSDGNPRVVGDAVDIGAFEVQQIIPFSVAIHADSTNALAGFPMQLTGSVSGGIVTTNRWSFGDGTTASNQLMLVHIWPVAGDYPVLFTAFNDANPGGLTATVTVHIVTLPTHHYVAQNGTNPVAPYLSWSTAATNIQDAVDAAFTGGIVVVSNGVYHIGSRVNGSLFTNRVVVNRPMTLQSTGGPAATLIDGAGAMRCVYLADGATLDSFILTNGYSSGDGGGAWCVSTNAMLLNCSLVNNSAGGSGGGVISGTISNCNLIANSASGGGGAASGNLFNCRVLGNSVGSFFSSGGGLSGCVASGCVIGGNSANYAGGGAESCTLNRCVLTNNSAAMGYGGGAGLSTLNACTLTGNYAGSEGGGAQFSTLNNCLLSGNLAEFGGGALGATLNNCTLADNSAYFDGGGANVCTLNNCIVYFNSAWFGGAPDYSSGCVLNFSCATPLATSGAGNITNAPLFVNQAGGDYHLQASSPCINSGNNTYATGTNDLDGNLRITGGTVDIGAYEFQSPSSVLSYAWLQQYGLSAAGSADNSDPDGDGMSNWQEWIAGTNPTNALSVLRLAASVSTNDVSGITVTWQSVAGKNYFLQRSSNLAAQPPFTTIQSSIAGQDGTTCFADTTATNSVPYLYRVGVQ